MKNYKKIIILAVLFVAVAGLTMSTVSAKTYSKTINFKKEGCSNNVKLGHGDYCIIGYGKNYQMSGGEDYKRVDIFISSKYGDGWVGNYYKATKAKVYYKKTNSGEVMSKTYSIYYSKRGGNFISKKLPSGYKPTKVILYYQKK